MRRLPKPPRLTAEDLPQLVPHLSRPAIQQYLAEVNTEYRHWEKVRHRPAPEGLTAEQGWQLIKWSRMGQKRTLPLKDKRGKPFTFWLPLAALEILHEVDRWGGTTLALAPETASVLGTLRDRVIISSLMEEAIATSQIEGAVTTRKVAKELLRTNRKPRDRSEQMIVNSYRTIQLLRQRLDPLSLDLLVEIQESMTQKTLDDSSGVGRFRTADDDISVVDIRDNEIVFVPPPADQLEQRLARLVNYANTPSEKDTFVHPLVKAAILHFWLAYEHPFIDGNGRTARALFYWFMLKSGYWVFEFLTISRVILASPAQYYRSFLYSEQDDNDLTYSLVYQIQATRRALTNLREYLTRKQEEQQHITAALRQYPDVNHRQRALLEHALRKPGDTYSFESHKNSHGITYVTARADLLDLLKRGFLADTRGGKRRLFLAASDLAAKLDAGRPRLKGKRSKD